MSEFNIDNFLDDSTVCHYPEWLNLDSYVEKNYYDEILSQSKIIEVLIEQDNDSKLTPSMRKITASALAKSTNKKNRSSFNKKRYPKLFEQMEVENTRLKLLWNCKVESNKKSILGLTKVALKERLSLLEDEIKELKSNTDKMFLKQIIEVRRKSRFTEFQRTIDDKNKRIEQLEIQNAELQLKLRDVLRPIK